MTVMSAAIECHELNVRYRAKRGHWVEAVKDLSFCVQRGEIVGFLGPNGAGKSSTLKALMGFIQPSSGTCAVLGQQGGSVASRQRIGYLPEVAMYYPFLTPVETLRLYGELQGLRGKALGAQIVELLESVGLADARSKLNKNLSKGQLQRVGIAQSLLGSPQLLILDEVTSGLDPIGRKELRSLLLKKREEGATLFFSSHELSEVAMICDRIILVDRGRLVEERDMRELEASLRQYRVTFDGSVGMFDLTNHMEIDANGVTTAHFESKRCLLKAIERLTSELVPILDIVSREGSLEDYFIDTISRRVAA